MAFQSVRDDVDAWLAEHRFAEEGSCAVATLKTTAAINTAAEDLQRLIDRSTQLETPLNDAPKLEQYLASLRSEAKALAKLESMTNSVDAAELDAALSTAREFRFPDDVKSSLVERRRALDEQLSVKQTLVAALGAEGGAELQSAWDQAAKLRDQWITELEIEALATQVRDKLQGKVLKALESVKTSVKPSDIEKALAEAQALEVSEDLMKPLQERCRLLQEQTRVKAALEAALKEWNRPDLQQASGQAAPFEGKWLDKELAAQPLATKVKARLDVLQAVESAENFIETSAIDKVLAQAKTADLPKNHSKSLEERRKRLLEQLPVKQALEDALEAAEKPDVKKALDQAATHEGQWLKGLEAEALVSRAKTWMDACKVEVVIEIKAVEELASFQGKLADKMGELVIRTDLVEGEPLSTYIAAGGESTSISGPEDLENVQLPGAMKVLLELAEPPPHPQSPLDVLKEELAAVPLSRAASEMSTGGGSAPSMPMQSSNAIKAAIKKYHTKSRTKELTAEALVAAVTTMNEKKPKELVVKSLQEKFGKISCKLAKECLDLIAPATAASKRKSGKRKSSTKSQDGQAAHPNAEEAVEFTALVAAHIADPTNFDSVMEHASLAKMAAGKRQNVLRTVQS